MINWNKKLILGTVQFGLDYGINNTGGQISEADVFHILDQAYANEILFLDTAAAYGNSEERIGKYLNSNPDVNFKIITKFDLKENNSPIESLEKSLEKLKTNKIDTIMFHNFDDFIKQKSEDILSLIKLKGIKFDRLGISVYTNEQIQKICKLQLFEVVQLPFNAFDNQIYRSEYITLLKENNIEVHTRSVFLQGLFFMETDKIPNKIKPLLKNLFTLQQIANKYQVSIEALALQYALSIPDIDNVLMGVDSLEQLKSNLNNVSLKIDYKAFEEINDIIVQEVELLNPAKWYS
jgi:aryl-alcohol dehydrogenase-like predicted oxidoreductase